MADNKNLFEEKAPLSVLRHSTIATLSVLLNDTGELSSDTKRLNNYIGLCELIGFSKEEADKLSDSSDPTAALLDKWPNLWERTGSTACIGKLWCMLRDLGRDDVLREMEEHVREDIRVEKDSLSYEETEMRFINTDSATGKPMFYDGFVAYDEVEEDRITQIVKFIEKETGLRMFYYPRDMEPGLSIYPAQAYLIEKRCRKLICFVTKDFIKSPFCSFVVRYAHHLSPDAGNKKILPLILDKLSPLPTVLTPVVKVDFSSCEQMEDLPDQLGWSRFVKALSPPPLVKPVALVGLQSRPDKSSSHTSVDKDQSQPGLTDDKNYSPDSGPTAQSSQSQQNVLGIEIEMGDIQTEMSRLMVREDEIYRRSGCNDEDFGIESKSPTTRVNITDQDLQNRKQNRGYDWLRLCFIFPCLGKKKERSK